MLSPAEFVNFYAQVGAKKCANSTQKLYLSAVLARVPVVGYALVVDDAGCYVADHFDA